MVILGLAGLGIRLTVPERSLLWVTLFFVAGFVIASLVEYWIHRLMHRPGRFGERHRDHHRRNEGQGVVWDKAVNWLTEAEHQTQHLGFHQLRWW